MDKIGITADKALKMYDVLGPEILNRMSKELCGDFPNTYCFTKALAEEAVLSHGSELPITIFRPGIGKKKLCLEISMEQKEIKCIF